MNGAASSRWLLWPILLAGFAGVWNLQYRIDAQRAGLHQEQDDLVLRSPAMLKILSLEYKPLVADLYWTRVVQYYGEKHARHDPDLQLLWPLLDITTTLDPNLLVAYRFGSTFLSEPAPRGAGRPDQAVHLLERGIRANPDQWRLYQDLGYVYYFDLRDYAKASAAFLEGSKNPKAQIWMKVLAAKVMEEGQTRETSAFLWSEIYKSTTDEQVKANALTHLRLIRAEIDQEQLDKIAAEFEKQTGRRVSDMRDLINAGMISRPATDPQGFVYVFDANGKAQVNPESPLAKESGNAENPL